jgi:hypothetical protein
VIVDGSTFGTLRLRGTVPNSRDANAGSGRDGKIVSTPVLGGLYHRYERKAA